MANVRVFPSYLQELASFLASSPSRQELVNYHPSKSVQRRASQLLGKKNEGKISYEEEQELEEFAHAERLMRLIKVRLRYSTYGNR